MRGGACLVLHVPDADVAVLAEGREHAGAVGSRRQFDDPAGMACMSRPLLHPALPVKPDLLGRSHRLAPFRNVSAELCGLQH